MILMETRMMRTTKKMKRTAKGPTVMAKSDSVIVKKYINMKLR